MPVPLTRSRSHSCSACVDTHATGGNTSLDVAVNGHQSLKEAVRSVRVFTDRNFARCRVLPRRRDLSTAVSEVAEWAQTAGGGDLGAFARRLAFDGLEIASAANFVMDCHTPADEPIAAWALAFHDGVAESRRRLAEVREGFASGRQRIATTTDLWTGFVVSAQERLRAQAGPLYPLLSPEAHAALELSLAGTLAEISRPTLELELEAFRARSHSTASLLLEANPPAIEAAYVDHLAAGGMVEFFLEYPMLARLMGTVLLEWVDASAELVRRVDGDWPAIRREWQLSGDHPAISAVDCRKGDRHYGGRCVMVVSLASGAKLVYKPRDLGIETAYNGFIEWLNQRGLPLPLRSYRVLDRGTHGWAEFIEGEPQHDEQAHRTYCRRFGILLCIAYLLRATDLHAENIVVAGDHPVLVDLETLLHPDAREFLPVQDEVSPTVPEAWNTVLRTGLLPPLRPCRESTAGRHAGANAGLQGMPGASSHPLEHPEDVIEGFCQTYRVLLRDRDVLLGFASPLEAFARRRIRFIFRSTRTYARVLQEALRPRNLRNGVAFSISIEALSRIGCSFSVRPGFWPIIPEVPQS